jgi:hypothetical protein
MVMKVMLPLQIVMVLYFAHNFAHQNTDSFWSLRTIGAAVHEWHFTDSVRDRRGGADCSLSSNSSLHIHSFASPFNASFVFVQWISEGAYIDHYGLHISTTAMATCPLTSTLSSHTLLLWLLLPNVNVGGNVMSILSKQSSVGTSHINSSLPFISSNCHQLSYFIQLQRMMVYHLIITPTSGPQAVIQHHELWYSTCHIFEFIEAMVSFIILAMLFCPL